MNLPELSDDHPMKQTDHDILVDYLNRIITNQFDLGRDLDQITERLDTIEAQFDLLEEKLPKKLGKAPADMLYYDQGEQVLYINKTPLKDFEKRQADVLEQLFFKNGKPKKTPQTLKYIAEVLTKRNIDGKQVTKNAVYLAAVRIQEYVASKHRGAEIFEVNTKRIRFFKRITD